MHITIPKPSLCFTVFRKNGKLKTKKSAIMASHAFREFANINIKGQQKHINEKMSST